jgi:uncharacterized protein (DUF58 family)
MSTPLPLHAGKPWRAARQRLQQWFESRLPLADMVTLEQRNVYILPTGPGWMLAATLVVMLVAAINYQLNLGYLLTFLLAGCALVGMHVCHGTLRGLAMNIIASRAYFTSAAATFDVKLSNGRPSARHGIGVSILNPQDVDEDKGRKKHWVWADVPAQGSVTVQVAFTPARRGLHRLPTLTAETRFPLGTFRVWTVWRPATEVMIYPAPERTPPPLPAGEPRPTGNAARARLQSAGETDGVRGYRRGDPMKLVVWRKAAKLGEHTLNEDGGFIVRDSAHAQQHELWLDLARAGAGDLEHKLSRLTAWVLQADKLGLTYGLALPAGRIEPGNSDAHKRHCLEALALC